ncbi:hypothetical protein EV214_101270 [Marinisporobacter balticus]|uniref:YqzL-like protein n=1 Tax=Marinisporobacter balticus TaxID=2018667 RepID=A0A4R2L2Y9_9FIRM|nr:hypothetical protein EV214_101270 [Marinisporobacter balticus]
MLEKILWNLFLTTGNINIYMNYKNLQEIIPDKEIEAQKIYQIHNF